MQLFIILYGHKSLCKTIEVEPTDTISTLKHYIQLKFGIFHAGQQLMLAGRCLYDNDKTIAEYNIQKDSTINLYTRNASNYVGNLINSTNFNEYEKITTDHIFTIQFSKYICLVVKNIEKSIIILINDTPIPISISYNTSKFRLICKPLTPLSYGAEGKIKLNQDCFETISDTYHNKFGSGYHSKFFVKNKPIRLFVAIEKKENEGKILMVHYMDCSLYELKEQVSNSLKTKICDLYLTNNIIKVHLQSEKDILLLQDNDTLIGIEYVN